MLRKMPKKGNPVDSNPFWQGVRDRCRNEDYENLYRFGTPEWAFFLIGWALADAQLRNVIQPNMQEINRILGLPPIQCIGRKHAKERDGPRPNPGRHRNAPPTRDPF